MVRCIRRAHFCGGHKRLNVYQNIREDVTSTGKPTMTETTKLLTTKQDLLETTTTFQRTIEFNSMKIISHIQAPTFPNSLASNTTTESSSMQNVVIVTDHQIVHIKGSISASDLYAEKKDD